MYVEILILVKLWIVIKAIDHSVTLRKKDKLFFLFIIFLNFILFLNFTKLYSFAKYQNESTTGILKVIKELWAQRSLNKIILERY